MPTTKKVTTVKAAPVKVTPPKGATNPAAEAKALKSITLAHDLPDLPAAIRKIILSKGTVAVTAQHDKAADRKMQQRIQSIAVRSGYDLNWRTSIRDDVVIGVPRDPSAPKTEIKDPAKPRPAKATTPAPAKGKGKVPASIKEVAKQIVADPEARAALEKAGVAKAPTTRKVRATRKVTDAKALYDASFGKSDQEKAERLKAKEAEAAAASEPHDIVIDGTTVLTVVKPEDPFQVDVDAAVQSVTEAIVKLPYPLPAVKGAIRIGARGTDPVLETNAGDVVLRTKSREFAVEVLAAIEKAREEATTTAA